MSSNWFTISAGTSTTVTVPSSLVFVYVPSLLLTNVVTVSFSFTMFSMYSSIVVYVLPFTSTGPEFTMSSNWFTISAGTSTTVTVPSSLVYVYVPSLLLTKVVNVSFSFTMFSMYS